MNQIEPARRVLVFVNHFHPYAGGLETAVLELYAKLRELHPNVCVDVVCNNTEKAPEEETVRGLDVHRMDCRTFLGGRYSAPKLRSLIRILSKLKERQYDLINTHTRFFINTVIGFCVAKWRGVPHVHTEHGASFTRVENWFVSMISVLFDQTLGRMVLSLADTVVANSAASARFAKRLGARHPVVTPNGVDAASRVFDGDFSNKEASSLIFVGRLVFGKGVQDLLAALRDVHQPWKLRVVGDGPFRKDLEVLTKQYGLTEYVQFLGQLEKDGVHCQLARSQIFISPTFTEGFGMTVIEAGLEGCAVIASNVGGPAEIIDDGVDGCLIDGFEKRSPERVARLRDKVVDLLDNSVLARTFGERLNRKVTEHYTLEMSTRAYWAFIA